MSKVALVTGGQQGIGLGVSRALRQAGFDIFIAALPAPDDPTVQAAKGELGASTRYSQHDVADIDRIPDLLDEVETELGPVITFVSNAGVAAPVRGDILDITPTSWDLVQSINLRGAFFLSQAVARRMLKQPTDHYCSMIFVTSVSASMASLERGEYCVSKAGASMMAQLFAVRLASHNIGVFELRPGIIATDMTAGVRAKYDRRIMDGLVPSKRWGEADDIGMIAAAMATGQMRFANGAAVPVDGGLSIPRL